MTATIKLGQLAEFLGATLRGSPEKEITGLATLQEAGPAQLSFLANPQYRKYLGDSQAAAVLLKAADAETDPGIPVVFADGKPAMLGAELLHGVVAYFNDGKRVSFSTRELGAMVRQNYDMHTYSAFITAGEHQPMPDSFAAGDLMAEWITNRLDRNERESCAASLHQPLNQQKQREHSQHSRAEWFLGKFAEKVQSWREVRKTANGVSF